jgi:RimJ/RimL family protein N-acetyltransferase
MVMPDRVDRVDRVTATLLLATPRLRLVPVTGTTVRADVAGPEHLSIALDSDLADDWPPTLWADDRPVLAEVLATMPDDDGWRPWYWLLRQADGSLRLIGVGGFAGPPDDQGVVTLGFSVVPSLWRRGYASEAVAALVEWSSRQHDLRVIEAFTDNDNLGSVKVLQNNGFVQLGWGSTPNTLRYELRRPTPA